MVPSQTKQESDMNNELTIDELDAVSGYGDSALNLAVSNG